MHYSGFWDINPSMCLHTCIILVSETLTRVCVCIHALLWFLRHEPKYVFAYMHYSGFWTSFCDCAPLKVKQSIKDGLCLPYSQPVWTACLWWSGRTARPRWPVYVFAPLWVSSVRFYALIWAWSPAGGCARLCIVVSGSYRCLGTDVLSGALLSERTKCRKHTWALDI